MSDALNKAISLLKLVDLMQPPGITKVQLAKKLNKDIRTIERYFLDLEKLGFENDKDRAGRHFIFPDSLNGSKIYLTASESDFLSDLMKQTHPEHPLTQTIQTKLILRTGGGKWFSDNLKKKIPKIIQELSTAMKMNRQIEILNYYSAYRGEIVNRKIQPLSFTTNYRYLIAFEEEAKLFVNIKIDRISEINILDEKCSKSPNDVKVDIFQMAFNEEHYKISLLLTPLAYRILIEERPGADDFTSTCDEGKFKFRFKTEIATFLPISRFCMGMPGEIMIEESEKLLEFLRLRKEKFLW